ncbi:hypothetical protein LCGC14_2088640, partial [marine sediment metagenome]
MLLQDGIRSIFTAALDATIAPGLLDDLATEREDEVARNGKFTKLDVGYIAAPPPPLFWEYRCSECRYWQTGACAIVQGRIDQVGYCVQWIPPKGYEAPFTWIGRRDTALATTRRAVKNLASDPFSTRSV